MQLPAPLSKGLCPSLVSNEDILARVVALLHSRAPLAVARLVMSIVVHSLQRVLRGRTAAHVGEECEKTLVPRLANSYASASVVSITGMFWIGTPEPHCDPHIILRSFAFAACRLFVSVLAAIREGGSLVLHNEFVSLCRPQGVTNRWGNFYSMPLPVGPQARRNPK